MELYALSLNGNMLYFCGKIPETTYEKIDSLIQEIDIDSTDRNYEKFCKDLTSLVKTEFGLELLPLKIEYIFRK